MKKISWMTAGCAIFGLAVIVACNAEQAKAKPNFVTKDAPHPGVVAKIGGEEITDEVLVGEDKMDFFELEKRKYDLRMDRLNKLVQEKLIGAEAKKDNMSLEDFIDKKVVKGTIKISPQEFDKFVAEKRIPKEQINPQIKERINKYLEGQKRQDVISAYVAKLTRNNPVEVYFAKPKMDINVEVGNAPIWGKESAPVTIVEFSDFQCPFCSRGADVVQQIKAKYGPSKVRIAFRHFPLPMHKEAMPAAEMSECVREQGVDKFWKYHDLAFKGQDKLDETSLVKYAQQAGADSKKAEECFKAGKFKGIVQSEMKYGEKVGVKSTPTFFVNGQMVAGALPIESFAEMIDDELANSKKK